MICARQTAISVLLLALAAGCEAPPKQKPIWEGVKIGDLAPAGTQGLEDQKLSVTDLRVFFFEIPADNLEQLDELWPLLFREPFKFRDETAFATNSFQVGFGRGPQWNELDRFITQNSGVPGPILSIILLDGQTEDVPIVPMQDATIFYITSAGSMEGVSVGAGALSLQLTAEKIPGARGIRRITAVPSFKRIRVSGLRPPSAAGGKLFNEAGFEVPMSPGDFFLLAPQRYIADQMTLGSAFFSRPGQEPAVRLCIVLCARIDD